MEKSKASGFTKWLNKLSEDIVGGPIPDEITYKGYTTTNLHHSEDARRAFLATIQRAEAGQIHDDSSAILQALKDTDTYMKLNDMHLEQGKSPDQAEIAKWKQAHIDARKNLNHVGEFMHHMDYWHMHEHELQDELTQYNPETAGADMADSYNPEGELVEELTDKTIRSGDKVKVARVIADMLGVENAESMSPEIAINTGLRKIKNKRMTPEFVGVVKKMLTLAQDVGIKVDQTLVPKAVTEAKDDDVEVDKNSEYNAAKGILRFNDYAKLSKINKGEVPVGEGDPTKVGSSLHPPEEDQLRRMKVRYKTEEKEVEVSADYKTSKSGKKYPAHQIVFNKGEKQDVKEEAEDVPNLSDDELDKIANDVDNIDDVIDVYDDNELKIVDDETGEEVKEDEPVNEETLNEVMSRMERMRARMRFIRTAGKRARRLKIVLHRRSDTKTINKRARRLAINLIKQRIMRKPVAQMSVAEKERIERMLEKRKALIDRLAMRLAPRVRRIEADRLSHQKTTQAAPAVGM